MRQQLPSIVLAAIVAASSGRALAADPVCGDVNASGTVTTSDALNVLRESVGQSVELQCPPPGLTLKTGLTKCFGGNSRENSVACAGTGEDAETQLGVTPSYTASYGNNGSTVTDNATGLMWEQQGNRANINDMDTDYRWASSAVSNAYTWQGKIAALNAANFAGHNDWRLPNVRELQTLVKFWADTGLMIDRVFWDGCCYPFCSFDTPCTAPAPYWTSTTVGPYPHDRAYVVNFKNGTTEIDYKTALHQVRAVRGPL